jgi:hypothetical protein
LPLRERCAPAKINGLATGGAKRESPDVERRGRLTVTEVGHDGGQISPRDCVEQLDGFEFEGKLYRSLTSIARKITGAGWSGPRFFGLAKAADASGGTDVPLGKSDLDGRRAGDPSQCMEVSDA